MNLSTCRQIVKVVFYVFTDWAFSPTANFNMDLRTCCENIYVSKTNSWRWRTDSTTSCSGSISQTCLKENSKQNHCSASSIIAEHEGQCSTNVCAICRRITNKICEEYQRVFSYVAICNHCRPNNVSNFRKSVMDEKVEKQKDQFIYKRAPRPAFPSHKNPSVVASKSLNCFRTLYLSNLSGTQKICLSNVVLLLMSLLLLLTPAESTAGSDTVDTEFFTTDKDTFNENLGTCDAERCPQTNQNWNDRNQESPDGFRDEEMFYGPPSAEEPEMVDQLGETTDLFLREGEMYMPMRRTLWIHPDDTVDNLPMIDEGHELNPEFKIEHNKDQGNTLHLAAELKSEHGEKKLVQWQTDYDLSAMPDKMLEYDQLSNTVPADGNGNTASKGMAASELPSQHHQSPGLQFSEDKEEPACCNTTHPAQRIKISYSSSIVENGELSSIRPIKVMS